MHLTLSIITPSFNQGRFIERTIQSVLNQDIPSLDYFICDGGSTDNTLDVLKKYNHSLRFVSEKDKGQTHAVNKGIQATQGDIIGWLNSDDIYYPNILLSVMEFFSTHPEVDVLYGQANHIDEQDRVINRYPTEKWNINRLKKTCFLSQPAVFFRRTLIEKYGLLDEKLNYCMDYEFWLRLGLKGAQFYYLPEVLAGSRLYADTKTMQFPLRAQEEVLSMLKKQLGYIPVEWVLIYAITYIKKTIFKKPKICFFLSVYFFAIWTMMRKDWWLRGIAACIVLALLPLRQRKT